MLVPVQSTAMPSPHYQRKVFFDYPGTAYIKITEGCSNYCSYCAIPLIRGELRSRQIEDVVLEAQNLISKGMYELVLIGQDLGNYGKDLSGQCMLLDLMQALSNIEKDFRIRFLYIHPDHFPSEIGSDPQKNEPLWFCYKISGSDIENKKRVAYVYDSFHFSCWISRRNRR